MLKKISMTVLLAIGGIGISFFATELAQAGSDASAACIISGGQIAYWQPGDQQTPFACDLTLTQTLTFKKPPTPISVSSTAVTPVFNGPITPLVADKYGKYTDQMNQLRNTPAAASKIIGRMADSFVNGPTGDGILFELNF